LFKTERTDAGVLPTILVLVVVLVTVLTLVTILHNDAHYKRKNEENNSEGSCGCPVGGNKIPQAREEEGDCVANHHTKSHQTKNGERFALPRCNVLHTGFFICWLIIATNKSGPVCCP